MATDVGTDRSATDSQEESNKGQARDLPTFDELQQGSRLLHRIDEIRKFSFAVSYQDNGSLTREDVAEAVLSAVLGNVTEMLVKTKINYLHEIKTEAQRAATPGARLDGSKAVATISFGHSVFQFSIRIYADRFVISRESSSLADFYAWYRLVMPNAAQLEATARQAVARKLGTPMDVTRSGFEFGFVFSDFTKVDWGGDRPPRNVDVLSKLVGNVPNSRGSTELNRQDFMRIDLNFSRLERFRLGQTEKLRNCWYTLEAPSNERSRFLVFTAQMRNIGEDKVGGASGQYDSIPFDPEFTDDYVFAVRDFLKERALDSFMFSLLEGWKFQAQRQL